MRARTMTMAAMAMLASVCNAADPADTAPAGPGCPRLSSAVAPVESRPRSWTRRSRSSGRNFCLCRWTVWGMVDSKPAPCSDRPRRSRRGRRSDGPLPAALSIVARTAAVRRRAVDHRVRPTGPHTKLPMVGSRSARGVRPGIQSETQPRDAAGAVRQRRRMRLPAVLHLPSQGSLRITSPDWKDATVGYIVQRTDVEFIRLVFRRPRKRDRMSNIVGKSSRWRRTLRPSPATSDSTAFAATG